MNKPTKLFGFLFIYLAIVALSILGNLVIFSNQFADQSLQNIILYCISQVTFTHFDGFPSTLQSSYGIQYFSILITQITGILFYTFLLWQCWQLFGNTREKNYSIKKSLTITILVIVICETLLFAFFYYGIPAELTGNSIHEKFIAAITLAVNSFHNAGFTHVYWFFNEEVISSNFMIQVGIIGGSLLGSLGIYVLIDLFSPMRLRQRLNDPSIDWRFITKLSLFGSVIILAGFSIIMFHLNRELFVDKHILDSISLLLSETSNARGFGMTWIDNADYPYQFIRMMTSMIGSGPFTTSGGIGLFGFVFIIVLLLSKRKWPSPLGTVYRFSLNWLIFSTFFLILAICFMIISKANMTISELLFIFTTNNMKANLDSSLTTSIIKIITNLGGRLSFLLAGFLTIYRNNRYASSTI